MRPFLVIGLSGRSLRRAVFYLLLAGATIAVSWLLCGAGAGLVVAAVMTGTVWAVVRVMNASD